MVALHFKVYSCLKYRTLRGLILAFQPVTNFINIRIPFVPFIVQNNFIKLSYSIFSQFCFKQDQGFCLISLKNSSNYMYIW